MKKRVRKGIDIHDAADGVSEVIQRKTGRKPIIRLRDRLTYTLEERDADPRLWRIWRNMFQRCYGRHEKARYYEGIRICKRWHTYSMFFAWAQYHGYGAAMQIDRIDHAGDYCPENCRWVDRSTQMRNTRRSLWVEWRGEKVLLKELCERHGVPYGRTWQRIYKQNWSVEDAILKEPQK